MQPRSGRVVVTDSSFPVPLSEGGVMILAADVDLFADPDNTAADYVWLGERSVRYGSRNGGPIAPGDTYTVPAGADLSTLYMHGNVGDAVSFLAFVQ